MVIPAPINEIIIYNNLFLELYGSLIGDGWLGEYHYKNKINHVVGLSGHAKLDRDYFDYIRKIISVLFNRNISIKEKPKNTIELYFSYKMLVKFLNQKLDFPIGKKTIDLKLSKNILELEDEKIKHVLRGIFDTDGSFFIDRVYHYHYPNIEIEMKAPKLLDQIEDFLRRNEFKPQRRQYRIRLKGIKQVNKWMKYIGSNNPKHFNKYNNWLKTKHG